MVKYAITLRHCGRAALLALQQECRTASAWRYYSQKQHDTAAPTNEYAAPTVLVEKDDHITLIGLNREHARNSVDTATARRLCEALTAFEADSSSAVAVLYGVGGSFCAGNDLIELEQQLEHNNLEFLLRREGGVGPTRQHLHKPVVCGISGYCVASGLELALLCDLRVMEDTAVLGFFNRRQGVPLSDGGTARLPGMIGYARAVDLVLTGRHVSGWEALQMGLVNRLVATGTALGQAVNLAFSIAKFPMAALQHDRSALHANRYERKDFHAAVQQEIMSVSAEVRREIQEGVSRFRNSKVKGAKTNSWHIKSKPVPDWEQDEIAHEERAAKEKLKGLN